MYSKCTIFRLDGGHELNAPFRDKKVGGLPLHSLKIKVGWGAIQFNMDKMVGSETFQMGAV